MKKIALLSFSVLMILISFIVFNIQKTLNLFVFWNDYPSFKKWLGNTEMNISGIIQSICVVLYFVNIWAFIGGILLYLLYKIYTVYGK